MKFIFLTLFLTLSCSKDDAKKLDTSFLKIGKPGFQKSKFTLEKRDYIHVLDQGQNVEIIDPQQARIKISDFDLSELQKGDMIVGNGQSTLDKYLLKVESINYNDDEIEVEHGTISDLTRDQKGRLELEFTPLIEESAVKEINQNSKKKKVEVNQNVIEFNNYTLLKSGKGSLSSPSIKLGKGKFNISKNKSLEVVINKGRLEVIPTFRGDYKLGFMKVEKLDTTIDALVKYKFEMTIKSDSKLSGNMTFPLIKPITFPIRFMAGPVPIYVDVIVDFSAGMNIAVGQENTMTFTVESEYALNAGTYYEPKLGATFPMNKDYLVKTRDVKLLKKSGEMSAEFFLRPKIQTLIYRTLGPYAYIQAGVEGSVKFPLERNEDDLFVNLTGGVGASVHEPIFKNELLSVKSPALFNMRKGWDLIGPKNDKESAQISSDENTSNVEVDDLDEDNKVSLKLKSDSEIFTKVNILKMPRFGRIVHDREFEINGIVHYYPPRNFVEGEDSFRVQYFYKGQKSSPKWIKLRLSEKAKGQTKEKRATIIGNLLKTSEQTGGASSYINVEHESMEKNEGAQVVMAADYNYDFGAERVLETLATFDFPSCEKFKNIDCEESEVQKVKDLLDPKFIEVRELNEESRSHQSDIYIVEGTYKDGARKILYMNKRLPLEANPVASFGLKVEKLHVMGEELSFYRVPLEEDFSVAFIDEDIYFSHINGDVHTYDLNFLEEVYRRIDSLNFVKGEKLKELLGFEKSDEISISYFTLFHHEREALRIIYKGECEESTLFLSRKELSSAEVVKEKVGKFRERCTSKDEGAMK